MAISTTIYNIFKAGSRTYFYSSLFFPKNIRERVFRLYAFVRKADNFVDSMPQRHKEFTEFRKEYERAIAGKRTDDEVVAGFVSLFEECNFRPAWCEAFLDAMESDLRPQVRYYTLDELRKYMHGSAEVIGLMMSRILGLSDRVHEDAMHLGRAMQYVNFIRDLQEDLAMGRSYLPLDELERYGLRSFDLREAQSNPQGFSEYIRAQVNLALGWFDAASHSFNEIPPRCRIPIKTASDMYRWTARIIHSRPFVVYTRKVRPSVPRIVASIAGNSLCMIK
ncbi:MAG: phytoene/squalene synthase family protein [Candidatus Micrarchaeia archaeon]